MPELSATVRHLPFPPQELYSGSLTNLAYVSRKQALSQLAQGAVAEAQSSLAEALEYAHLAVRLKRRIADVDELPVALHNLALIHLCRGWLGGESPQQAGEAAQAASAEGLAVLERIASSKKRFALCLENALALALLGQDSGRCYVRRRRSPRAARSGVWPLPCRVTMTSAARCRSAWRCWRSHVVVCRGSLLNPEKPSGAAPVVLSGQSDYRRIARLRARWTSIHRIAVEGVASYASFQSSSAGRRGRSVLLVIDWLGARRCGGRKVQRASCPVPDGNRPVVIRSYFR